MVSIVNYTIHMGILLMKNFLKTKRKSLLVGIMGIFLTINLILKIKCGERGIRTPGTSRYNGFQDHRIRPLCHLSLNFQYKYNLINYMLTKLFKFTTNKKN